MPPGILLDLGNEESARIHRGFTRFEQFQKSLSISPNSLSRRLAVLVDAGLLERRTRGKMRRVVWHNDLLSRIARVRTTG